MDISELSQNCNLLVTFFWISIDGRTMKRVFFVSPTEVKSNKKLSKSKELDWLVFYTDNHHRIFS